jgi:hypothetical protein
MRYRLLEQSDRAWEDFLAATRHDFYHLPDYARLEARRMGGRPGAVLVDDHRAGLLMPVVLRPLPGGRTDATSPYGYPGLITKGRVGPSWLAEAWRSAMDGLTRSSVVSLFVRSHPLLTPALPRGRGIQVRHADTVVVELSRTEEELWDDTRHDHRKQIRQALQRGYMARWADPVSELETWQRLYTDTMRSKGASEAYAFDEGYMRDLILALGERLRLVHVSVGPVVVAAGLWVTTCGIVQSFLSATDQGRSKQSGRATKLMYHFVRQWAARGGQQWLHLGGGLGATEDSLHHFKAGFSSSRWPYRTIRVILDQPGYEHLVGARVRSIEAADPTAFFPAYRASG